MFVVFDLLPRLDFSEAAVVSSSALDAFLVEVRLVDFVVEGCTLGLAAAVLRLRRSVCVTEELRRLLSGDSTKLVSWVDGEGRG